MIEKINLQLINSLFETNEENSITLKSCLEEGDLLYLPIKLYHRVDTLGPRISISYHFTDAKRWKGGKRKPWYDWIGDING